MERKPTQPTATAVRPLPPAPGETDSVALALANTRTLRRGLPDDALPDPGAVAHWLHQHDLIPQEADFDATRDGDVRQLRSAIRTLLTAAIDGATPSPEAVEVLNAALRAAPNVPSLRWPAPGQPEREDRPQSPDPVTRALTALATDALALLCGSPATSLAACAADDCIRLFLRRHAKRQWCSARCGDRARVARHYARHRTAR
ncbi:CGNR zinc finger domain-containing protein [Streptomyces sp. NPDC093261]|uniref:CGNR zinc finger domain-containing protein n=1 Tax=Streptomyces sp. NPDC093261 TaxID=3366037 RepID=UPI00381749D6